MKLKVYSVYDQAAKAFTQPFYLHNDGLAVRSFQDNVNHQDSQISKHPDQFTLFLIGEFNDVDGTITCHEPKSLGTGLQYVNPSETSELQKTLDLVVKQTAKIDRFLEEI